MNGLAPVNGLAPGGTSPKLKLTRRGRAVFGTLIALVLLAVLGFAAMFGATQASASDEASSNDFGYVVVQPGESLWSVATALDPNSDPRDTIAEIVRLNQLDSSGVQAGQPVAVPLRFSHAPGVVGADELGL